MLHAAVVRVLTSGILWQNYHRVNIVMNMPLPLQIMGIRFLMKVSYKLSDLYDFFFHVGGGLNRILLVLQ